MARTSKATTKKTTPKRTAAKPATAAKAAAPSVKGSSPTKSTPPEVVMRASHDDIARKAYEIWMAKGCPDGCDEQNWHEAEASIRKGRA